MTARDVAAAPASDFRSDTVTRPTAAMRDAMASAEVGDDVLDGDPTVRRLEVLAAEWLGKADALYVPSGTMANQVAMGVWRRAGEEIVCERSAHVVMYEAGALGVLHGLQAVTLEGTRGALDADAVRAQVKRSIHSPRTAAICVEQTHMSSGGRVVPLASLDALRAVADETGVALHMDGARLAHAVVATGTAARDWTRGCDSVSLCLSKGLGAPVGSVVAGDEAFCGEARVVRKRLGGWMRQAGIVAAAGIVALESGVERLAEDHALARALAERLDGRGGIRASPDAVETNLVLADVSRCELDGPELARRLGEHGVGVMALEPRTVRFVTHRDVGSADLARLERALDAILGGA